MKREPVSMNERGPADRGRSLRRESAEDHCSLQLRDDSEATEATATPVIGAGLFVTATDKKVTIQLGFTNISRNGNEKKHAGPACKKKTFLLTAIQMYSDFANI